LDQQLQAGAHVAELFAGENPGMSFNPYAPYGAMVETTFRVVTWNVWGRYGEWSARLDGIIAELKRSAPDIVCLEEAWATPEQSQGDLVGEALGLPFRFRWGDWQQDGWTSGGAICSRWPIAARERRLLPGEAGAPGTAVYAGIDGPRGVIELFVVMLDYPLHASGVRQHQVRELVKFVTEAASRRHPVIMCGDFNAGPDSDELRMLTGRSQPPAPGMVFYDAWEVAGDGGPGFTWSNQNPLAAVSLLPDRRFDYVLSAWPRRGGAGHPVSCELLGVRPRQDAQLSDHYGVVADLRY
jgi:endonuclease/exonuclease/phosphatase family metal-dependent hydrolase